jgi:cyclophilin family peptidyl-prolyl cis-trans isomerase
MTTLKVLFTAIAFTLLNFTANAQGKKPVAKPAPAKPARVKITTDMGVIIVRLYDATPKHRDNFLKLVQQHFFDSLLFHRVMNGFMIQGGDPLSKNAAPGQPLGMGGGEMARIPAEFNQKQYHKKGVLAAARDNNPERASSACQFYLVQGSIANDISLNQAECAIRNTNPDFVFTPAQRKLYKTIGGTPQLDMNYTVFGEIEKGFAVVDKIAGTPTDPGDRPLKDIRMKIELIK